MALGDFHSRIQSPIVAMYPILCDYNIAEAGVLPLFFPVRKFFESQVQVPMGSLARPVTGNHAHDGAGYDEYRNDYQCCLYHASVPLMWPSMRATAIAEMNMPVMMYTKYM